MMYSLLVYEELLFTQKKKKKKKELLHSNICKMKDLTLIYFWCKT